MSPEAKEAKYLQRGEAFLKKKDYARALLEFRNAATAMPGDAEPRYRMGLAYLESGDMRSAVREFQRATGLDPKHSGAQLKLAEFMTASQDQKLIEGAVSQIVSAFGPSPGNPEALDAMAIAEWKLGKPQDATQHLEEALKRFPTHLQSSVNLARMQLSRNDQKGAEQVLKKAVADAPQSSPAALALAELYILMRQFAQAETELKRAIQLDPKNGAALIDLGAIQIAAKRIDEAEQVYKQLSALPDKAYKPLHAMFLYQFGKREAALKEFEQQAKADPNDREARTRLVAVYSGMNRVSDAENLLAAALKRNPKDTDALLQRAELRVRSGKGDDAEKDLTDVLHFRPDSVRARVALADVYRIKGLENSQRQELEKALQLDPSLLQTRLALAMSFLAWKHNQEALVTLSQAPDYQKRDLQWIIGHNWALLSGGNAREAKTGIEQALQNGRPATAVFQKAIVLWAQRDAAGALAHLDELWKRDIADANVARLMMQIYEAQREMSKGMAKLKELAGAHPNSPALLQLLGEWYIRGNNPAEARSAFERAKAADAHFIMADLSLAQMDIQEGRHDAALKRLDAAIATGPASVPALLLAARANEQTGNRTAAIGRYRAVLAIDGTNLIALNNLAYELAMDNSDEALKFAQQAAEIAPDSPNVQDTLGWIYYRRGFYSAAVRYLKTAVDKESTPKRQFHLGMSYLKAGEQTAGQKFVRDALLKDPNLQKTEKGW